MNNLILEFPYKDTAGVACIKLNRPKVLNALCTELMEELVECLWKLEDDKEVKVIILTGNEKALAAGADISEMSEATPVTQLMENKFRAWGQLGGFTKPIIAAVSGYALGGGCELAMSCDMIVASETAKFGQPEITIGTIPGASGTQRLTKALGKSKSMYYTLTGELFGAQEAFEWGLVAKVFKADEFDQEVLKLAKSVAAKSMVATRLAKEAINNSFETSLKDGLDFERRNFFISFSSHDQKEGMKAFLEKRKPEFQIK